MVIECGEYFDIFFDDDCIDECRSRSMRRFDILINVVNFSNDLPFLVQLENTQIIEELKREKYDLGICEYFAPCGFGIFELANIPAHIVTSAPGFMEGLTDMMGVPNVPSYVPSNFYKKFIYIKIL